MDMNGRIRRFCIAGRTGRTRDLAHHGAVARHGSQVARGLGGESWTSFLFWRDADLLDLAIRCEPGSGCRKTLHDRATSAEGGRSNARKSLFLNESAYLARNSL